MRMFLVTGAMLRLFWWLLFKPKWNMLQSKSFSLRVNSSLYLIRIVGTVNRFMENRLCCYNVNWSVFFVFQNIKGLALWANTQVSCKKSPKAFATKVSRATSRRNIDETTWNANSFVPYFLLQNRVCCRKNAHQLAGILHVQFSKGE